MTAEHNGTTSIMVKVLTGLVLVVAVVGFFVKIIQYTRGTNPADDPSLIKLNQANAAMGVRFGHSPICGGSPCWLQEHWSDLPQFQAAIPRTHVSRLPEYEQGIQAESVFYQFLIPVGPELKARLDRERIGFTPVRI